MRKIFATITACIAFIPIINGQITLDRTIDGGYLEIINLSASGKKIIVYDDLSFWLYNLDYTLWKRIFIPKDQNYSNSQALVVSETFFDSDPNSIEFIVRYYNSVSHFRTDID